MNTPRWFYAVLAGCAVVLTVSVVMALNRPSTPVAGRYQYFNEVHSIFDTQTGTLCAYTYTSAEGPVCFDANGRTKK